MRASQLLAVVGWELSARAYPSGPAVRDAGQLRLLRRLQDRLEPHLGWRTEVAVIEARMADSADRRAWDAVIEGSDWEACLDAETRVGDLQAVQRRVALKQRDGGARNAILLHADTRHHRELLRLTGDGFQTQFPITARRSLAALGAGRWPGGNSLILL